MFPATPQTCFEGPFGELLRATGPMAKANPFQFSTKFKDDEADLLYYGYRYCCAGAGRWLSRDPSGRKGGVNLYGFVGNAPISAIDALGLLRDDWMTCGCTCLSVDVAYHPGGNSLALGWYHDLFDDVFGSRIDVTWHVLGPNKNECKLFQDERGTSSIATGPGGFSETLPGKNEQVPMTYTDNEGLHFRFFEHPTPGKYHIDVTWRVTFRCKSSSGAPDIVRTDSANLSQDFTYPPP